MTSSFQGFLLLKLLFSRDKKSDRLSHIIIAMLGIFVASFLVFVALGVLSGYQQAYHNAVLNFSAHLVVMNHEGLSEATQNELRDFLKQTSFKNDFSFYHFFEALMPGKNGFEPVIFKGIDPAKMRTVYPLRYQEIGLSSPQGVYVGKNILEGQPGIATGEGFKFLSLEAEGKTTLKKIPVAGYFESGYFDFDAHFVFLPLGVMREFFGGPAVVSGVEIRMANLAQLSELKTEIARRFQGRVDILTWDELNSSLFEALKLERTVVFAVSFLILMIACLNIFGFNFLFFIERKREFLILSALGMGLKNLRKLLTRVSLLLGGVSAGLGSTLGLLLLLWLKAGHGIPLDPTVYLFDRIPVDYNFNWLVMFVVGALFLCYVTSLLAGRVVLKRHMTANLVA